MRPKIFCLSLLTCIALMAASAADSLSLPFVSPMFGDNMVLQRGKPIRFWGWARAGESVRVERAGHAATAVTGPDGRWQARIHPLAIESLRRREVLLLKPLVNWKYALATLERMRRYADELGWAIPPDEEAEVWRTFEAQSPETRAGMVDRYRRTGHGGFGVSEEVACRFP